MQFSESFKLNIIDKYIIIVLYSFLPISFIIGSAVININIILIDILFIYSILKFKNFNFQYYRKDIFFLLLILFYLSTNSFYQNIIIKNNQFIDEGLIRSLGLIRYVFFYFSTTTSTPTTVERELHVRFVCCGGHEVPIVGSHTSMCTRQIQICASRQRKMASQCSSSAMASITPTDLIGTLVHIFACLHAAGGCASLTLLLCVQAHLEM